VIEIKPKNLYFSLKLLRRHTAYQRTVLATTMDACKVQQAEPRVLRNDSAKEVEKMPKDAPLCCHDCNVSTRVPCIMCRVP